MVLESYAIVRPFLYHLTHRDNLKHIKELGRLFPAAILMDRSGSTDLMRTPRRGAKPVTLDGRVIVLRDQDRLHKGNAGLPRGYRFEDLVVSLNNRIFFWPGTVAGPIPHGIRHFERYVEENPIILRIDLESLQKLNPNAAPLFCRYNSGSPRCTPPHGRKSPRGPNTFLPVTSFKETPSKVVEVTFDTDLILPPTTEFSLRPKGPWKRLL